MERRKEGPAEEGVPPEGTKQPHVEVLRRWLTEQGRPALEASVLEACQDAGCDEAEFVQGLQTKPAPELARFFDTLPVVVVVNEGEGGAGFHCDDGLVVKGIQPGSACQLAGLQPGWCLDRFQRKPIKTPTTWSAVASSVSAAPRPWRFRFLSQEQKDAKQQARTACLRAIERLGQGRLRVLKTTPYYDVTDAETLVRAARAKPAGMLSLGEFTRVLSSTVTDAGVACIKHRLGWSAIVDSMDHTANFEKLQPKDEPSLAFVRKAATADSEESRRVRVISRLHCYEEPGAGQMAAGDLRIGSVIMLEDVAYRYEGSQPGSDASSTMFIRHDQQQRAWSPCLTVDGAHALMPWSAAEQGLPVSIAQNVLGRTSEDADEVGGGTTALAENLVDAVVRAPPTKRGKKQSAPELAGAIAMLLKQRVHSSADQCPALVQSVLKCLRLVIEVLGIEERAALEAHQNKKKKKRGASAGELSRALKRTILGLVEELQFFEDGEKADISFLHATASSCKRQLERVDETGAASVASGVVSVPNPRETVTDMRDSTIEPLEMAEKEQGRWIAEQIHAGLDVLEQADLAAQVASQTGASDAHARRCLDAMGWDVDAASNHFFDLEAHKLLTELTKPETETEPEPEPEPEPGLEPFPGSEAETTPSSTDNTSRTGVRRRFSSARMSRAKKGASESQQDAPDLIQFSDTIASTTADNSAGAAASRATTVGTTPIASTVGSDDEFEKVVLARLSSAVGATDATITRLPSTAEAISGQADRDEAQLRLIQEQRAIAEIQIFLKSRGDDDVTERLVKALRGSEHEPRDWLTLLQRMEMTEYRELVSSCRIIPGCGVAGDGGK